MTATPTSRSTDQLKRQMFAEAPTRVHLTKQIETRGAENIALYRASFDGPSHASGVSEQHILVLHLGVDVPADCRIGNARLDHRSAYGNVTIVPAGMDWSASLAKSSEKIVVSIPVERAAIAAAQAERRSATLAAQLRGHDPTLFSIIREMWGAETGSSGVWHGLADELADRLVTKVEDMPGSRLSHEAIARLNAHIDAHIGEQIPIDTLAEVAGAGRSNFPRIFRRTFGISPHQYVVRLRLRRARGLVGAGRSIAEAAFEAGFADQSHFTNWLRRLYGATPGGLT